MKDKERQEALAQAFQALAKQKDISPEEMQSYIVEVLEKVFSKDKNFDYENEDMELADVKATFDIETGAITIQKKWEVVDEIDPNKIMRQVLVGSEEAGEHKVGDIIIEDINIFDQLTSKIQQIKSLLIQKTREAEKEKLYEKFAEHDGKIINAKVTRVEDSYYILDYEDTSIFLPRTETLQRDNFRNGEIIRVYIASVDKVSKDAQVVASRVHPKFVKNVIEEEIEDVKDGIVEIVAAARTHGFKTKVAVKSNVPEVDPVGAIIGVKGNRIRKLMEMIGGERIDVIKYSDDINEYIASALTPAKVIGVKYEEKPNETDPEKLDKFATVVVNEENFLSALGKGGKNVKLAVILTGVNIDVKTEEEAKELGIEYTEIKDTYIPRTQRFDDFEDTTFEEFGTLEDLAELESEEEIDYNAYSQDAMEIAEEDAERENEFAPNVDSEEIEILEKEQEQAEEDFEEFEEEVLFDDSYDEYDEYDE